MSTLWSWFVANGLLKDIVDAFVWLFVVVFIGYFSELLFKRKWDTHVSNQDKIANLLDTETDGGNKEIKDILEKILETIKNGHDSS
jgi:peptidoglycan hydrolase CwlO-like protein